MQEIVRTYVSQPPAVWGSYLEEMIEKGWLTSETAEILRAGYRYAGGHSGRDMCEPGGRIQTVTADMLDELSDEDLLSIQGMNKKRLKEVREAIEKSCYECPWR